MKRTALASCVACVILLVGWPALAAPEAHILRIDPRATYEGGEPLLTTVIELVQHKRKSDITRKCARLSPSAERDCMANALEQPQALYAPFLFPEEHAFFTITVDGTDLPTTFESKQRWGDAKNVDGVGTAWLIMIDAAGTMGSRFLEAKRVAKAFIAQMGAQDIVNVVFIDSSVVDDSRWTNDKRIANNFIDSIKNTYPKRGRSRQLVQAIKQGVTDSFKELGNAGAKLKVPMHQALVVLSNGSSGSDLSGSALVAGELSRYLSGGRFPEDNTTLPKMPLPVISVWFPATETEEFFDNARQFMENLANPSIGGMFTIVQGGQAGRGPKIARAVQQRFDETHLVRWRVACVAPQVTQKFKLVFKATDPPIAGDNCIDCPLGIDPGLWPLSVDIDKTNAYAKKHPVEPGGTVKIFGDFCWGGDDSRADLYMVPKGQSTPERRKELSPEDAKEAQQSLIRQNMRGSATAAGDTFVEFEIPDTTKFLEGKGEKKTARLVIYDSSAKRTSDAIELPAREAAPNYLLIGGIAFGGLVLLLLLVVIGLGAMGGRKKRGARTVAKAPRPVAAPPRPGAAPAAGAPPMGGQPMAGPIAGQPMGGQPIAGQPMGGQPIAGQPMGGQPMGGQPIAGQPMGGQPIAGQPMGGQPIAGQPMGGQPIAGQPIAGQPIAGQPMGGQPIAGQPMAGPIAGQPMGFVRPPAEEPLATQAILSGTQGTYPIADDKELKVGRDPGVCGICLTEPRVSGFHATLKLDNGQLYVRDEGSNNGTYIGGMKIQAHTWQSIPNGGAVKFGPIEFTVRLE